MINIPLNHEYTPEDLVEINDKISAALNEENLDAEKVFGLIVERDEFIQNFIASTESPDKHAFLRSEIAVNDRLKETVSQLTSETLSALSSFIKGRKAVEKYK